MFAPRIEKKPRASFDDAAQPQSAKKGTDLIDLVNEVGGVGVQGMVVQGDSDALVTQVGEDMQGIIQAMVSEAVSVVPETHSCLVKPQVSSALTHLVMWDT